MPIDLTKVQLVADPGFLPRAWQAEAPRDMFAGNKPPVADSPDLQRILALPRRPQPDTAQLEALVEYMSTRFARPPALGGCRCREITAAAGMKPRPCITRLLPIQAWALYEIVITRGLLGPISVGGGKCVAQGTEFIDYLSGKRRDVIEPGAVEVATFNRLLSVAPASAFPSGRKACVTVRLADGCEIVPSTDHPVLTARGWVHAVDLVPERDFVAVAVEMPEPVAPTVATDDEVALVAYMLADGACSQGTIQFTQMPGAVLTDWQRCADTTCGGWSVSTLPGVKSKAGTYALRGAESARKQRGRWGTQNGFRDKWDLYGLAKEKRAHASIWGLPRAQVALFLNRFWACDGHVSKSGVEIILASEKLIDDIRFLCTRLGIRTRKHYKKASYLKGGERHHFDAWRIAMRGASAFKFLDEVGDVLGKEEACRALRARLEVTSRNTNRDVVPIGYTEVAEICDELGMPGRGGVRVAGRPRSDVRKFLGQTAGQYVSRSKFVEFCGRWQYRGKYAHLATTDVAWERVASVTDAGVRDVYDLSVPGTHNFVANGVIVHNTLLDILAPLAMPDCRKALLLVPPGLIKQLVFDYETLAQHFLVPSIIVHAKVDGQDYTKIREGMPSLHVLPYSKLSRHDATVMLDELNPDTLIADECHRIRHAATATTSRVLRFFASHGSARFCGWSGSITDSSVRDYAHLAALALRGGSPLPLDPDVVDDWARALDPDADNRQAPPGALLLMCDPDADDAESVYEGFHRRLVETAGVVATSGVATDTELVICERNPGAVPNRPKRDARAPLSLYPSGEWPGVADCLDTLRADMKRPDGEEFVDAMQVAKCACELAAGFFYRWIFPRGEARVLILEWLEARKDWNKELRAKLKERREHMDSQHLGTLAAMRGHGDIPTIGDLPVWPAWSWPRWRDIKDSVVPQTEAVRLDDFLVQDSAEWGRTHRGIIWYEHTAFGEWLAEVSGLPMYGGGTSAEIVKESGERSVIASIKAHGTGVNGLQYLFADQIVANPPTSATTWEQLLGRLDRNGQAAATVRADFYRHTPELAKHVDSALARALYVQSTLGAVQKLRIGFRLDG